MRNEHPKILIVAALATLSCAWTLHPAQGKDDAAKGAHDAVPVRAATVEQRDMKLELSAPGAVVPYLNVAVKSRIDSQIMAVKFHAGDTVKKGQTLFVLDDRALKAQLAQAQAVLDGDKAQLANLQAQFDRAQTGMQKGFSSNADRDTAKAALDTKKAAIESDLATVDNMKTQLSYTQILSPIDGVSGTINLTEGNTVKSDDATLVTINQIHPISVQASLPQDDLDAIRGAMKNGKVEAGAVRNGSAKGAEGSLDYIDNTIDSNTGTFAARATFANADDYLWPGMTVNLKVTVGNDPNALVVPDVAVQTGNNGNYVFVVQNGKAAKRDVTLDRTQNGMAVVSKGLQAGEQVATDGLMALKDGVAVTIVSGAPAAAKAPDTRDQ